MSAGRNWSSGACLHQNVAHIVDCCVAGYVLVNVLANAAGRLAPMCCLCTCKTQLGCFAYCCARAGCGWPLGV